MDSIRPCRDDERAAILAIVNAAAEAYRGVIPADRWHEPYMPLHELDAEIAAGDLAVELARVHVGLVPAVGRYRPAVGLGGGVDDREDRRTLVVAARADGLHDSNLDSGR